MSRTLSPLFRWRPLQWGRCSTLGAAHSSRLEVCPPSLRCAPEGAWQRLLFWLLAPAPQDVAPAPSRMPAVRNDFLAAMADVDGAEAPALRERIRQTRSLRELWHVRAEVYRIVGLAHSQAEAERRLARLSRHFPTRAPRSQLATL